MPGVVLVAAVCAYGMWANEVKTIEAAQPPWEYIKLKKAEQQRIEDVYGVMIAGATNAYIERVQKRTGLSQYTVVFVDEDGCILYRVSVNDENVSAGE